MYKKIIVAVDIAEEDLTPHGFEAAAELAKLSGGEIRLVNVRSPLPVTRMDFIPPEFFAEQEAASKKELALLANSITAKGLEGRVSYASRFGSVHAEVLGEAKEWGADLVIVCAHRPTMATYLLGSSAAKIVRHAECAVLVARADKKQSLFG